jgi:hypothetical protein
MKHLLLSALLLTGVISCSKNDDATPALPANTLQLTLKNKQVVFPASATTLTISQKGTSLYLTAQALDTTDASITIRAGALDTESPGLYSADPYNKSATGGVISKYVYRVTGYYRNPCGNPMTGYVTYETGATPAGALTTFPDFALTVLAVDKAAHTMSGTFTGSYWKGCDKMEITHGQFNLPYTVVP